MTKVYTSELKSPQLPRSSIFHYVFPPKQKGRPHQWYPTPSPKSISFIDGLTGKELLRDDIHIRALWANAGLRIRGVKRGDVGMIFGPNSLFWVEALWAIQAAEAICSPANAAYPPPELAHQIENSGTSFVMVAPDNVPVLEKAIELLSPTAKAQLSTKRIILMCDYKDKPPGTPYSCMQELWGEQARPRQISGGEEKEIAYLCYSSGTTGKAKGVMTSHHNMQCQVQALYSCHEKLFPSKDKILAVLPFSHIYGLTLTIHFPLIYGVPVVVLPKFDPETVFKVIEKYRVTFFFCVPPMLIAMMNSPKMAQYDLSSLRGLMLGAAPCDAKLIEKFENLFPKVKGYGMTETSPVTHLMTLEEGHTHKGSIGKIMPTMQGRLVDPETGKDVAQGERGELWVRGPSVMRGYWKNEEATRGTFAAGGWLRTGDIAVADKEGYFYIVDRLKELIKYKGFQVPPAELEALLLTHSKIADVGVIGVWDAEQSTEMPRAYVVPSGGLANLPKDQHEVFSKAIVDWVADRVSNHKKLRGGVILLAEIPKSPSGKILRKDLRELAKKDVQKGRQAKL
ncbi:AMP binding protein [Kockovaella imperatae]|uniref:AMP binding protein n=1 Tax=Kockovaella imperatae TaxID=4999 RepID=A0A1Y1UGR3_9TREE|nr:AMP binding protein [Kockovaella imperatae]ORX37250.1 AMP binding protein [Kockovaella imperatae]